MFLMKESELSLKGKVTHLLFSYCQIARKYKKSFMADLLTVIFDDFYIRLLGYRIELSCLYCPHGHCVMCNLWLCMICLAKPHLKGNIYISTN